jgi:hypothetical protein
MQEDQEKNYSGSRVKKAPDPGSGSATRVKIHNQCFVSGRFFSDLYLTCVTVEMNTGTHMIHNVLTEFGRTEELYYLYHCSGSGIWMFYSGSVTYFNETIVKIFNCSVKLNLFRC